MSDLKIVKGDFKPQDPSVGLVQYLKHLVNSIEDMPKEERPTNLVLWLENTEIDEGIVVTNYETVAEAYFALSVARQTFLDGVGDYEDE